MNIYQFPFSFVSRAQYEVFTTSKTFIVPNNVTKIYVTCIPATGGGGGGGSGWPRYAICGGGGGGGGYGTPVIRQQFDVLPNSTHSVVIGLGGTAGYGGPKTDSEHPNGAWWGSGQWGGSGGNGGTSSFGSLLTVTGGSGGGAGGAAGSGRPGGAGGSINGSAGTWGGNEHYDEASYGLGGPGGILPSNLYPSESIIILNNTIISGGNGGKGHRWAGESGAPGTNAIIIVEWGF